MLSFLLDLLRDPTESFTVIVVDTEGLKTPRQYILEPKRFMQVTIGIAATLAVVLLLLIPPVRHLIFGNAVVSEDVSLQSSSRRLTALQDSLETQEMYLLKLRQAILGVDSTGHKPAYTKNEVPPEIGTPQTQAPLPQQQAPISGTKETEFKALVAEASKTAQNWKDHVQPALSMEELRLKATPPVHSYLSGLHFPVMPPINGFATRSFDPSSGHYGVDVAVDAGANVRAIGDGYVIFADWTHETGFVVVVQHQGGYVSVYRHNMRILKRVGEKVRAQESIALSGNSGEMTTGPHLHFELWHEGLAQDPKSLIIGW
jgi:murein DD-endopeptidase MepM/ murein hydrolase activator NlpD